MKLEYTVTEQDYIALLTELIRNRDRSPMGCLTLLLLTVGQVAAAVWLCVFRLERERWPLFLVGSLLIAAITVFRRCTRGTRAKSTLYRLKANHQLPEDYWKPHRLSETRDGLQLAYGGTKAVCPPEALGQAEQHGSLLYLHAGEAIFDMIPDAAFPDAEAKERFLARLDAIRAKALEAPPEEDAAPLSLSFAEGAFLSAQVSAHRALYARHKLNRPASLVKLALSVFLLGYAARQHSAANLILAAAISVLLNYEPLLTFTPLARPRLRKELGAWADSRDIALAAGASGIRCVSGSNSLLVPYGAIRLSEDARVGRILYWGRQPAVVLPPEQCATAEGKAFLDRVAEGRAK